MGEYLGRRRGPADVSWPDGVPAESLHKIADAIGKSRPWWVVWWGEHTRCFWAIAAWVHGPVLSERTPDALLTAMHNVESAYASRRTP
jgi:hypothetical protein